LRRRLAMAYDPVRSLELLRFGTQNATAAFRDGQEEAIRNVVDEKGRLLVVQKTGWGKSFVYFIATKLLREQGHGPVVLISPLLALMRNQIVAATLMGVRAFTINSENPPLWVTCIPSRRHPNLAPDFVGSGRRVGEDVQTNSLSCGQKHGTFVVMHEYASRCLGQEPCCLSEIAEE
jgi:hypothetical protein